MNNNLRKQIISQVQRFQELTKTLTLHADVWVKLKNIISSRTLRRIRGYHHVICSTWGKEYDDVETMLKIAEKLRKAYVNLIFRTGFIHDRCYWDELDKIPLALEKIIKNYES